MKLYHRSLETVSQPEIRTPLRRLDHGFRFYTTTSFEQAESWVKNRMREYKSPNGYINVYEFDEKAYNSLKCLIFQKPTDDWVDFVMQNRTNNDFNHDYDIVYGPVANYRVFASFALYESGILDKATLVTTLKTYVLVDQLLFHSEKSLQFLKFIESKEVRNA